MTFNAGRTVVKLQYREVLPVRAKLPLRLHCVSGSMWLTAHRVVEDWLLREGCSLEFSSQQDIVVQALASSELIIEVPR